MQTDLVEGMASGKYVNVHFAVVGSQLRLAYEIVVADVMKKQIEQAISHFFEMKNFEIVDIIDWSKGIPPAAWIAKKIEAVTNYLDKGIQLQS
jgi:hypothetical protein